MPGEMERTKTLALEFGKMSVPPGNGRLFGIEHDLGGDSMILFLSGGFLTAPTQLHYWLVVSRPPKNMKIRWDYRSQYMENKSHVPNHQPD
jgi:hypothetical protein